jgi:hypothetical protein
MAYRFNPLTNQFEQESNTFNSDEILAYVNDRINDLVGSAASSLDTLAEFSTALQNDPQFLSSLQADITSLSGTFANPVSGLVQLFANEVNTASGDAGLLAASGILNTLLQQNLHTLNNIQTYFLDSAIANHGDFHVDHLTVGTSATADYTPRSTLTGQLIP